MENKDDLISRRAVLNMLHNESVMHVPYEKYEAAAREDVAKIISQQVKNLPGQMTAAEAWEIAGKLKLDEFDGGMSIGDIEQAFGTTDIDYIMKFFTPEEAKAKIEAWENRLKVGDVVEFEDGDKAVVTIVSPDSKTCCVLIQNGDTGSFPIDIFYKIGKTIDIQGILDQLGE